MFKEEEHPRDAQGKFTDKNGGYVAKTYRQNTDYGDIIKTGQEEDINLAVAEGKDLLDFINSGNIVKPEDIIGHPLIQKAIQEYIVLPEQETIHINTPDRNILRQIIANEILSRGSFGNDGKTFNGKVQKGYRAEIVIGPPAAGKSSVIVDKVSRNTGSMVLDSDEIKKLIPESEGGKYAGKVHEESSMILNKLVISQFEKGGSHTGYNIVIPIVGRNEKKALQYLDLLKEAGYEVHLSYNEVDPMTSLKRATTRYIKDGRFIDPNYVFYDVAERPRITYERLKNEKIFDSYAKYDNDVPYGEPARKIERKDKNLKNIRWENWQ